MKFDTPLIRGTLVQRYKRFLADVVLDDDGTTVTAHCANSGSMLGVKAPGSVVWLSRATNPKRKLKFTWELIEIDGTIVGINTGHPNTLVAAAIESGAIAELGGYTSSRREVKYGKNSRIDILLDADDRPKCYVEVKNVTLCRDGFADFPDAVTARGTKHLHELSAMVAEGYRAVMIYLVQRADCSGFRVAQDIDPAYAKALRQARAAGVEAYCYACRVGCDEIDVGGPLPVLAS